MPQLNVLNQIACGPVALEFQPRWRVAEAECAQFIIGAIEEWAENGPFAEEAAEPLGCPSHHQDQYTAVDDEVDPDEPAADTAELST